MALDGTLAAMVLLLIAAAAAVHKPGELTVAITELTRASAFPEPGRHSLRQEPRIAGNAALYETIEPPASGLDLVRNLRFALDHDVVLRRDFSDPETLKRFFGSVPASYRKDDLSIDARWVVRPPDAELARLEPEVAAHARCRYAVDWRQQVSGKRSGWIGVSCNYPAAGGPMVDEVEQAFGAGWKETRTLPERGPPLVRTAPHGNARLTYVFDKGSLRRSILVAFRPDGTFGSFDLVEGER